MRTLRNRDTRGAVLGLAIGRSGGFSRMSTLLLTLVALLTLVVMTYVERAYAKQWSDFENNHNLRVISVDHKSVPSGAIGRLEFGDSGRISGLLSAATAGAGLAGGAVVSNRYELGTAIETSEGRPFFVYGFDPDFAPALGLSEISDGVGYTLEGDSGETDLKISVVTAGRDGYTSGSTSERRLAYRGVLRRSQLEYLLGSRANNSMIVNTATFARIASAMYAMDWAMVRRSWESGELSMTPLIGGVAVYLPDIDGVRPAARRLQRAGYDVDYGLRAFDDLAASLRQSTVFAAALLLLFLIGVGGYLVISWRAYLRLSRRDIGILKHWGVPDGWIRAGYGRRLLSACLVAIRICLAGALIAGVIAFGPVRGVGVALMNWAFTSCLLLVTWKVAAGWVVGRQVREDILTLLTKEREFQ